LFYKNYHLLEEKNKKKQFGKTEDDKVGWQV